MSGNLYLVIGAKVVIAIVFSGPITGIESLRGGATSMAGRVCFYNGTLTVMESRNGAETGWTLDVAQSVPAFVNHIGPVIRWTTE